MAAEKQFGLTPFSEFPNNTILRSVNSNMGAKNKRTH